MLTAEAEETNHVLLLLILNGFCNALKLGLEDIIQVTVGKFNKSRYYYPIFMQGMITLKFVELHLSLEINC